MQVPPVGLGRGLVGHGLAGQGSSFVRLLKREERAGSWAGGQEQACQALLAVQGEHSPELPGGPGPSTPTSPRHPLPSLWVPRASGLTWPKRLAPGGDSQPRIPSPGWCPSPALMSAGLAAFQLIFFCPMLCLPSGLLRGLGRGGHSPQGQTGACTLAPVPVSPCPEVLSCSVTPHTHARPRCSPSLAAHNGSRSLAVGTGDTVPPQLTVPPVLSPCSTCGPGGQWQCEDHACLMDGELIDAINRGNYG